MNTGRPAYICDAVRTPIGRYAGVLSSIRPDDLAAVPLSQIFARHATLNARDIDDVILGCANQAGEDNRNVARMAVLLAGLPECVPAITVNRLCGSGMSAVAMAASTIAAGSADLILAGGVESMSRAPFVISKASRAFDRSAEMFDTTLGWRFINAKLASQYGVDSMVETGDNVARKFHISRADQDLFAYRSQRKAAHAIERGDFSAELCPVTVMSRKGMPIEVIQDEHPRPDTTVERLSRLAPVTGAEGTVTAGNASGLNDGACALLLASADAVEKHGIAPLARVVASVQSGIAPSIMGVGPIEASRKVMEKSGLALDDMDVIELNEAFASQALAVLRALDIADDDSRVNRYGGAIALGHPLGMSGARLVTSAVHQLVGQNLRYALCTMCVGVGQGVAMVIENTALATQYPR